jgi:putative PEP-CTERM system TPR-repeat lipoprotein
VPRPARRLIAALFAVAALWASPAGAVSEKASRFYDDALAREERQDHIGAIIQLKNALQADPNMLAAHVLLGKLLLAESDPVAAEVEFSKAQSLGVDRAEIEVPMVQALYAQGRLSDVMARPVPNDLPKSVRLQLLLIRGSALGELNDLRGAARAFDEARTVDPGAVEILQAEASQALRQGNVTRADAMSAQALARAPNNADAWAVRGATLVAMRKLPEALEAFNRSLAINPREHQARLAKVDLLIELNRDADAAKELEIMHGYVSNDPRAAYMSSVLAARRGDGAAVARELGEVVKIIDTIPPEIRNRRPQLLLLDGMAHYGLHNSEKARASFENFLRLQPDHPGANRMLAAVYLGEGEPTRAVGVLETYMKRVPGDAQAMLLLANAYMAQKRYALASNLLQQALNQGATDPALRSGLGAALAGQGQGTEGLTHLRAAFAARPDDPGTGAALAVLLLQTGDGKGAQAVMQRLVAARPKDVIAQNLLGAACLKNGDRACARKAFEAALAVDPGFATAQLNLARLDVTDGKVEAGRARLVGLVKRQPNNADALIDLALIDLRAGRRDEALRGLERAAGVVPRSTRAVQILVDQLIARGDFSHATEVARLAVASQPESVSLQMLLARAQLAAGEPEKARDTLADVRKLVEYDPAMLVEVARMQIQAKDLRGAGYTIDKALQAQADNYPALVVQAELAQRGGDLAGAERIGKRLNEKYPQRAAGQNILGDVALARGQSQSGVSLHRAAFTREPGADTALRVFQAYMVVGEPARGVSFLQDFEHGKPADRRVQVAVMEGQLHANDLKGARTSLETLLKQEETPDLLNNYALVLLQLGDPGALAVAEKAWKLAPGDPKFVDTYGWVLARSGQPEHGLGLLRDARLRDPRNPEVRFHLAWTLVKLGRSREAREELGPYADALRTGGATEVAGLMRDLGL